MTPTIVMYREANPVMRGFQADRDLSGVGVAQSILESLFCDAVQADRHCGRKPRCYGRSRLHVITPTLAAPVQFMAGSYHVWSLRLPVAVPIPQHSLFYNQFTTFDVRCQKYFSSHQETSFSGGVEYNEDAN
jgi:hypothetical protein